MVHASGVELPLPELRIWNDDVVSLITWFWTAWWVVSIVENLSLSRTLGEIHVWSVMEWCIMRKWLPWRVTASARRMWWLDFKIYLEITHCGYTAYDDLCESQWPGYRCDLEDEFYFVQWQACKLRASWMIDGLVERAVNGVVLLSTTRLVSPDWNVGSSSD